MIAIKKNYVEKILIAETFINLKTHNYDLINVYASTYTANNALHRLSSLSSLMEVEPEMPLHTCITE